MLPSSFTGTSGKITYMLELQGQMGYSVYNTMTTRPILIQSLIISHHAAFLSPAPRVEEFKFNKYWCGSAGGARVTVELARGCFAISTFTLMVAFVMDR
jgi:hypothetical protein